MKVAGGLIRQTEDLGHAKLSGSVNKLGVQGVLGYNLLVYKLTAENHNIKLHISPTILLLNQLIFFNFGTLSLYLQSMFSSHSDLTIQSTY